MPSTTIQFFEYEHLPAQLQIISKQVCELAHKMEHILQDGAEKSTGMRKLLEANDCFMRAGLHKAFEEFQDEEEIWESLRNSESSDNTDDTDIPF